MSDFITATSLKCDADRWSLVATCDSRATAVKFAAQLRRADQKARSFSRAQWDALPIGARWDDYTIGYGRAVVSCTARADLA